MELTIGHLYPDLLNLYGDRGNIRCLVKRAKWRGIDASVKEFQLHDSINFHELDIVLLGGGSDREERLVCDELTAIRDDFKEYVEQDGVVLAICGGYQLLGSHYQMGDEVLPGLGLVDLYTKQGEERLIGDIIIHSDLFPMPITGFENHGGRTYINNNKPLGKVYKGFGNTDARDYEGICYRNVIGTYLHGPLLPKNPMLCDYVLQKALERKYQKPITLEQLDDTAEQLANQYICERLG